MSAHPIDLAMLRRAARNRRHIDARHVLALIEVVEAAREYQDLMSDGERLDAALARFVLPLASVPAVPPKEAHR